MRNLRKTAAISALAVMVMAAAIAMLYPGKLGDLIGIYDGIDSCSPPKSIAMILKEKHIEPPLKHPVLKVSKSRATLTLLDGEIAIKTYSVALGKNYTAGHKETEGDGRTPEGEYFIAQKQVVFPPTAVLGSRWLHLSYPNIRDAARGLEKGTITLKEYERIIKAAVAGKMPPQTTRLGGEIGVHGGHTPDKPDSWTAGCVALLNKDMEELYEYVPVGTRIIIEK